VAHRANGHPANRARRHVLPHLRHALA
jgi:hypothetical protein